jgi:hypothetical protein
MSGPSHSPWLLILIGDAPGACCEKMETYSSQKAYGNKRCTSCCAFMKTQHDLTLKLASICANAKCFVSTGANGGKTGLGISRQASDCAAI